MLDAWTGPYGGVPPFAEVRVDRFKPALEEAMAQSRRELDAIAKNPDPPTRTAGAPTRACRLFTVSGARP
jgi:peptidyl-dipeptidase Dcp